MKRDFSPILAQWDITSGCNFSCSFCLTNSGKIQEGELDYDKAKKIVDRLYEGGVLFLRVLGGEPFFRQDMTKIMHYASEKGMLISFSTNAALITNNMAKMLKDIEESINYFQVSLYGVDSESYSQKTKSGEGFEYVTRGISNLKNNGLDPYVFWVLTDDNVGQLVPAYELVRQWELPAMRISPKLNLGRAACDINESKPGTYWSEAISAFIVLNDISGETDSPAVQLHARPYLGEFLNDITGLKYFYITCKAAATMVYVDCRGDVSPCPFSGFMPEDYRRAFDGQNKISLLTHKLRDIWDSEPFRQYRHYQHPDMNPNNVFKDCPHLRSGMCNPCIYTPCTCRASIQMIYSALGMT